MTTPKWLKRLAGLILREELATLNAALAAASRARDDNAAEAASLRGELQREQEHSAAVTELLAGALASVEILEAALVERQVGARADPTAVYVVGDALGAHAANRKHSFVPLRRRRREAKRRADRDEVRRNALPAPLRMPALPLSAEARALAELAISNHRGEA